MFNLFKSQPKNQNLEIGQRIYISGGYDMKPEWLGENDGYYGEVIAFIPGQNKTLAAVIKVDSPIKVKGVSGDIVVLELRYAGAEWKQSEIVHVELCDFIPEAKRWQDRKQGLWVESHARYEVKEKTINAR
jgi:hypothetical protein